MAAERMCRDCGRSIIAYRTTDTRCAKCLLARQHSKPQKPRKPIISKGKQTRVYETWRDHVAIPYLDKRFGRVCSMPGCTATTNLDVDHIKKRGSHPHLKMDVKNVRYLCRLHHIEETDVSLISS